MPTFFPGWCLVPRWRTMMLPAMATWPPKSFTPRRLLWDSRPFWVLPSPFLCAMASGVFARCPADKRGATIEGYYFLLSFLGAAFFAGAAFLAAAFFGAAFLAGAFFSAASALGAAAFFTFAAGSALATALGALLLLASN